MKKRQIIIIAIGLAILIGGKFTMDFLGSPKEPKVLKPSNSITTVFAATVKNEEIPVFVTSSGVLQALNRVELFSEVQGVMETDNGKFKPGNSFKKGDVLISIRSKDQEAQLFSQRASFESAITAIMPDLKADFPEAFTAWDNYLNDFSNAVSIADLPEVKTQILKSFLVGRGIYTSFHQLKNSEIINAKYALKAPFDGVLIAANTTPGSLIRPGQALGTFIQPKNFELESAIDALTAERLKVGQKVSLSLQGLPEKTWNGKISRLVKAIDPTSQMSTFYVSVSGSDLKEGMYLQAMVKAQKIQSAFELPRGALLADMQVYVVEKEALVLKTVKPQHYTSETVIITGLSDNTLVLTKVAPSAFEGMKVTIYQENK
ncbi:MAG: membrane fusion protein (multidrug efflux system) [Candidatus Azotimanducaceae bacterium]|jgi:membrane fusion protein (multidrug efflux system)